jgi:hypothetical protein
LLLTRTARVRYGRVTPPLLLSSLLLGVPSQSAAGTPNIERHRALSAVTTLFVTTALASAFGQSGAQLIETPRFWNDHDLSEWATPLAGLNVRPSHFSEQEYYSAPTGDLVRTYPVYLPGREPAGYLDMVQGAKPALLLTPGARTMADWIKEGKRVFQEMDIPYLRSYDQDPLAPRRVVPRSIGHDGAVTTLEEWLDPARLKDDFQPSGFKGYKTTHRAAPGHAFGLALNAEERAALVAFLNTL